MSFSDHKITAFTHRIADLPDQPNLPADELKARFDSSPEQLRVSLNAVCDEAAALDAKVDGILTQTFEGTIDKSMLSPELAAEIDATVTEDSVTAQLNAEAAARESADSALSTRMTAAETTLSAQTTQIAQKCQVYIGTYTGNDADYQFISLGFTPKAVLAIAHGTEFQEGYIRQSAFALQNSEAGPYGHTALTIISNGFRAYNNMSSSSYRMMLNTSGQKYNYIAFR